MKMLAVIAILGTTLVTGCNKAVQSFVQHDAPSIAPPAAVDPTIYAPSQTAVKVSPGGGTVSASDMSASVTATPTRKILTSADISAQVGISRTRTQ
jgi:hypothetical protein